MTDQVDPLEVLRNPARLRALEKTGLLDAAAGPAFDCYTRIAQRSLDVSVATVNLLNGERQVHVSRKSRSGRGGERRDSPLSHSYCQYVVAHEEPLVVPNARRHPWLSDNPAIEAYDAVAYVGFPLVTEDGHTLGTLCVLDDEPREWTDDEVELVRDVAEAATREVWLRHDVDRRARIEEELDRRVRVRTRQLEEAQDEILARLGAACEFRDDETGAHIRRVGALSASLAGALDRGDEWVVLIGKAAPLHDIGKVGIPDDILLKEGPLTDEEFENVKEHTLIGAELLADGNSDVVQMAETIAHSHHERWDGTGYPRGLAGEEIPLAGRIVAVADAFDVMTHDRPYREALSLEEALEEIDANAGGQFDPRVASVLLQGVQEILDEAGEPRVPSALEEMLAP